MDSSRRDQEAWRHHQQQQTTTSITSSTGENEGQESRQLELSPMLSWQQQQQNQQQQLQQQIPVQIQLQRSSYDYIPTLPLPMQSQSYPPAPTISSPSYMQYSSPHMPLYAQQQQLQQQQLQQQPPIQSRGYNTSYLPYPSPQTRPQSSADLMPATDNIPSTWYPSTSETYYSEQQQQQQQQQQMALLPSRTSPSISPQESSRRLPSAKEMSLSSSSSALSLRSPSPRIGGDSGSIPIDQSAGTRWSGYPFEQRIYPSGMVTSRGSYGTTSSSGSTASISPSQSMSQTTTPHHHHHQYQHPQNQHHPYAYQSPAGNVVGSMTFPELSATTMIMPPPNPPPEIQLPLVEQENQRRAATACNFCRARKLRCDGSAPCRQCARRSIECIFSQTNPAKRRKKQEGGNNEGDGGGSSGAQRSSDSLSTSHRSTSMSSRRGSSSQGGKPNNAPRRSEPGPQRRQSKAEIEIAAVKSVMKSRNAHTLENSPSLQVSACKGEEKYWCRSYLPLHASTAWHHQMSRVA